MIYKPLILRWIYSLFWNLLFSNVPVLFSDWIGLNRKSIISLKVLIKIKKLLQSALITFFGDKNDWRLRMVESLPKLFQLFRRLSLTSVCSTDNGTISRRDRPLDIHIPDSLRRWSSPKIKRDKNKFKSVVEEDVIRLISERKKKQKTTNDSLTATQSSFCDSRNTTRKTWISTR